MCVCVCVYPCSCFVLLHFRFFLLLLLQVKFQEKLVIFCFYVQGLRTDPEDEKSEK